MGTRSATSHPYRTPAQRAPDPNFLNAETKGPRMTTANKPYLKGKWNEYKGKIKEKWGDLTDDDLDRAEGERDQLVGAIQQRYGESKAEAEKKLAEWEKEHGLA